MSSVVIQTLVIVLSVALAALYAGRRVYRTFVGAKKKDGGCAGGCGCSSDH